MRGLTYVLIVFAILAKSTFAQWVELESGTTNNLNSISAPALHFAVAAGDNATLLRTLDGGVTWTPLTGEPGIDYHAVSFPSPAFGLAAGTSGTILFTNSGGEIWETIETGWMHPYYAAHQLSPQVGFVGGVNSVFQPLIGRSSNGWLAHDFNAFYPYYNDSYHEGLITDLVVFTMDSAVATFEMTDGDGVICFTAEAGIGNWITQYIRSQPLYAVDFWGDQLAVAVGAGGQIMATINGGWYWSIPASPTTESLNDVCFGSADLVWAVGEAGTIIHSTDGGQTWEPQTSPVTTNLNAVSFANADTGYVAGDNGVILFTPNGGEGTPNNPPGEFVRVMPEDSSIVPRDSVLFSWTQAIDPNGDTITYTLQYYIEGIPTLLQSTDTTLTRDLSIAPNPDTLYPILWRVFATDGEYEITATNGDGHFYLDSIETANYPPGEFWRVEPEDSSIVYEDEISLIWTTSEDPDGDLVEYVVHLWSDPPGEDWGDTTIITFDTLAVITVPSDSIFYFHWTVHATAAGETVEATNGEGNFEAWWFNAADDPNATLPRSFSLSAYPNPFNPTTTLNLSLPVSSEAVLRVFDVNGRLVKETGLGRLGSGSHTIVFDGSELPSGIYVAAVETHHAKVAQKLVLMK